MASASRQPLRRRARCSFTTEPHGKTRRFQVTWLPWVLIAPQVVVIAVFFFWPAGQALLQSLQQQDAFGTSVEWVGWRTSAT